jgi:hypothetical protein
VGVGRGHPASPQYRHDFQRRRRTVRRRRRKGGSLVHIFTHHFFYKSLYFLASILLSFSSIIRFIVSFFFLTFGIRACSPLTCNFRVLFFWFFEYLNLEKFSFHMFLFLIFGFYLFF